MARVEPGSEVAPAAEGKGMLGLELSTGVPGSGEVSPSLQAASHHSAAGRGPLKEDQRELVPDTGLSSQVENLLMQVMDENRALRRRLEQVELRSHSSWHSGVQGDAVVGASPVSFTGEGESRFGEPVQTWAGLGRFIGFQSSGLEGALPTNFQGPRVESGVGYERDRGLSVLGVQPRSEEPGPLSPPAALGSRGVEGLELVPAASFGTPSCLGISERAADVVSGTSEVRHQIGVPRAPPPPLPGTIAVMPPMEQGRTPQSMRQFAAQAVAESSGYGARGDYHTPRSGSGTHSGFDSSGYPVSPGGTVIRPPPVPPPRTAPSQGLMGDGAGQYGGAPVLGRPFYDYGDVGRFPSGSAHEARPEEPAKYISELPKLNQTELSQSAVTCGNWLAQVRQVLVGLSPSATVWWQGVEQPATRAYQRWLVADPLGRLGIDPSSVTGEFDRHLYGRVESRAVSLLLAAVPQSVRDDVVTNRWLSSTGILFRVLCLFQPGGSSERSHLLSHLVNPDPCRSFVDAVKGLRKWQQGLQRAVEIHATLPDASLLLKGVDNSTSGLLAAHPMIGFRVNAFRHQLAIDYNPTVSSVVQLVRLVQAECEAASITSEGGADKKARSAAVAVPKDPSPTKSVPVPPPPPAASVAAVAAEKGEGKGKSGGKGKCLACGQAGHFRPECPNVSPDNKVVTADGGSEGSPKAGSPGGKGGKNRSRSKAGAQVKGVVEDSGPGVGASVSSASTAAGTTGAGAGTAVSQETLVAEATRLLKGVSLKVLQVDEEVDLAWVRSALTNVSNPEFCLVDSGATNALRPASEQELGKCRVIHVDLASGGTELMINECGTLLHTGPCQVILPANYLVQLGFSIVWRRRGCRIKHPKKGCLDVTVVKGCPLISREAGLALLKEYEERQIGVPVLSKAEIQDLQGGTTLKQSRSWLRDRLELREDGLTDVDQLVFLNSSGTSGGSSEGLRTGIARGFGRLVGVALE